MAQLILPNTIDAGTGITAAEHQTNYVAIRDLINGQLEGGHSGDTARNLALNTVRAQNQHQTLRYYAATGRELQDGVVLAGDGKVTPGAGLVLNYAAGTAWVTDSGGVIGAGSARTPVSWAGGSVSIAANASGNPRLDQIIATITDVDAATVSVLQGTANAATTIDNRTGAATLPSSAVRLADILMPNGFAGPFVATTHIRDRRPWARGANVSITRNQNAAAGNDYTTTSTSSVMVDGTNLDPRIELSGGPVEVTFAMQVAHTVSNGRIQFSVSIDDAVQDSTTYLTAPIVTANFAGGGTFTIPLTPTPSVGSHKIGMMYRALDAGTVTVLARAGQATRMTVREFVRQDSDNSGA